MLIVHQQCPTYYIFVGRKATYCYCYYCTSCKTTISHCWRPFKGIKYLYWHIKGKEFQWLMLIVHQKCPTYYIFVGRKDTFFFRQLHYSCYYCTSCKTTISHCWRPFKGINIFTNTSKETTSNVLLIAYLLAERLPFFRQLHYSCYYCTSCKATISLCWRSFKGINIFTDTSKETNFSGWC